jgi:uncharacterized protein (TIGR00369 family)
MKLRPEITLDNLNARREDFLPGLLGVEITALEQGRVLSRLPVRRALLAPNGFLHAASVIALADTSCGFGTIAHLPEGAASFTTIELKSNFLGTARDGEITCAATLQHGGRSTQVWDATVANGTGRTIALFRCTQMLLAEMPAASRAARKRG